jgi:hypothetical protein
MFTQTRSGPYIIFNKGDYKIYTPRIFISYDMYYLFYKNQSTWLKYWPKEIHRDTVLREALALIKIIENYRPCTVVKQ